MTKDDPKTDQTCVKDGATTGCTPSIVGRTEARTFVKDTADWGTPEMDPSTIDMSKVMILNPIGPAGEEFVCKPGDSGAGVFCPAQQNGWAWVGLLVAQLKTEFAQMGS